MWYSENLAIIDMWSLQIYIKQNSLRLLQFIDRRNNQCIQVYAIMCPYLPSNRTNPSEISS